MKTVFLIDDDIDDQEIFCAALQTIDTSINCEVADDGILALERLMDKKDFLPDYIFIDLNMPRINGVECLAETKKIDRLKSVPVFMFSTSPGPEAVMANKMLGAQRLIVKPANFNNLVAVLSGIVRSPLTFFFLFFLFLITCTINLYAQTGLSVDQLKALSVEELMNIEVTSVSKVPQKLTEVPSAIQVITNEDMKRSGVTMLPEIIRLASNLQVARSGAHDWGISARGFNGAPIASSSLANKLLVMIDGRTVYNPLFGGVYWDVQTVLKEDLEQIEVVSGPGGTLWGANAVNGVINVVSKKVRETQGLYAASSYGTFLRDFSTLRFGSHVDSILFFRVYGQRFNFNSSQRKDGLPKITGI
ncbi:MAG: TonB-dependent receptor plug domain-containing protein [Chitinophagaceae bacterium]